MNQLTKKPKRRVIFIVDDMEVNLVIGKNALTEKYGVYTFESGLQMLKVLEAIVPDLILLDIKMPEMDGYEILEKLKSDKLTSAIPVVFLTAMDNGENQQKGLSLGAIDYIIKPFSEPLLLERVDALLQQTD